MTSLPRFATALGAAALWLTLAVAPAHAGMRCGRWLVSDGDHQSRVRARCGDPDYVTQQVVYRTQRILKPLPGGGYYMVEEQVPVTLDVWVYDFGPNRFIQYAQFQNGFLAGVESGPYGSE